MYELGRYLLLYERKFQISLQFSLKSILTLLTLFWVHSLYMYFELRGSFETHNWATYMYRKLCMNLG